MISLDSIKNILIMGSGTLGLRIGLNCAMHGYNVKIYDLSGEILAKNRKIQEKLLKNFIEKGYYKSDTLEGVMSRIATTTSPIEAVKDIDLMSESVTENIELKQKMYAQFAPLWEEKTILTSNTSYLMPSSLADFTGRPELFCALHFHDVFYMNVVDVMPHPKTPQWLIDFLMAFGKKISQIPVFIKKENPGYIFNQMLMALLGAAGDLVTRDVSSIYDVDKSWMGNTKMHIGPFGMLDQVGLDTAWHIVSTLQDTKSKRFAELLKSYLDQGKLGIKTGSGFYDYPNPIFQQPEFLK